MGSTDKYVDTAIYTGTKMGFDPISMLNKAGLNPKQKIMSAITNKASAMTSQLSGALASKLSAAGASLSAATQFASAKTDALLSSAPEAFSSMAALGGGTPAIERISRSVLMTTRSIGSIPFDPQSVIPKASEEGTYSDSTIYPPDLETLDYFFKMDFMEYKRPSVSVPAQQDVRFSITLPIPTTLIESYATSYSDSKYGATLGNVVNQVDMIGQDNMTSGSNATALGIARGAGQQLATSKLGDVTGVVGIEADGITGLVDQVFGSIVNPHLAVFFQGPTLKDHQFNWTFAPRNPTDSDHVREIYYRIKRASLPSFTVDASHTTLEYPMMCRVRIFTKNGHELYPFKLCVISAVTMNYAPNGTPAFHKDGAPVLMALNISFKEIEYWTSDDILKEQGDDYVGFEGDFAQNQDVLTNVENFVKQGTAAANNLAQSVKNNPVVKKVFGSGEG